MGVTSWSATRSFTVQAWLSEKPAGHPSNLLKYILHSRRHQLVSHKILWGTLGSGTCHWWRLWPADCQILHGYARLRLLAAGRNQMLSPSPTPHPPRQSVTRECLQPYGSTVMCLHSLPCCRCARAKSRWSPAPSGRHWRRSPGVALYCAKTVGRSGCPGF